MHYFSPVPDILGLEKSGYWDNDRKLDMPGVDLQFDSQLELLKQMAAKSAECVWPERPVPMQASYYYSGNGSFGYSSACLLHTFLRTLRPNRVIEVGSGFSTLITAAALQRNGQEDQSTPEFTAIEPYPGKVLRQPIPGLSRLIEKKVEEVPLSFFESLDENDLLFIDSSHVIKIAGDVNYLYLSILPRLRPGVMVHIHDIQLPYDYPMAYFTGRKKYLWTEQYLLQALLIHNRAFKIRLAGFYLQKDHPADFAQLFPGWDPMQHRVSTSFYIQRVNS